jgi:hypothetical protein
MLINFSDNTRVEHLEGVLSALDSGGLGICKLALSISHHQSRILTL